MSTLTTESTLPTPDERIMAAIAHAAVLIPQIGFLAPVLIWITQREKSSFVAFQALQAAVYQLALWILWIVGGSCYAGVAMVLGFAVAARTASGAAPQSALGALWACIMAPLLLAGAVLVIYALVGAVLTLQGRDFEYVLIGPRVRQFLARPAAAPPVAPAPVEPPPPPVL